MWKIDSNLRENKKQYIILKLQERFPSYISIDVRLTEEKKANQQFFLIDDLLQFKKKLLLMDLLNSGLNKHKYFH